MYVLHFQLRKVASSAVPSWMPASTLVCGATEYQIVPRVTTSPLPIAPLFCSYPLRSWLLSPPSLSPCALALEQSPSSECKPILMVVLLGIYVISNLYRRVRNHFRGSSVLQTRLKSLSSMDTAVFEDKDVIS